MIQNLLIAFILSSIIVFLAVRRGSLSQSGGAGALIVGTLTFGLGGAQWGLLLGIFFVTSSLLSHFKEEAKQAVATEKFEKGHQRDIWQVFANGGLGAAIALLNGFAPSAGLFAFFVGVMATVTADTWATELGTLSKKPPRLITTGRVVEVGTSGGISPFGTAVSLIGGLLIGLVAGIFPYSAAFSVQTLLIMGMIGAVSGTIGSLFDSLLGATIQQVFYCDVCRKETERKLHRCGTPTRPLRGWAWLNNDWVNFLSSVVGGMAALLIAQLFLG